MCSLRYALYDYRPPSGLIRGYFSAIDAFLQRQVAEPGDTMPVCLLAGSILRLVPAVWSQPGTTMPPRPRMSGAARAAVLLRSRTYGPLYHRRQRCLVPASGYYEKGEIGAALAYVRGSDDALVAFAGLWSGSATAPDRSFILVSCALNRYGEPQPVILAPEQYDAWLNDEDPQHLLEASSARLITVRQPQAAPHVRAAPPAATRAASRETRHRTLG